MKNKLLISAASLALIASPAVAQNQSDRSDDFHNDDMIIVTAPYIDQLDILAGTSALTGEELTESLRGQIGDTLTKLPGVSTTSFAPGSSRPVLRGFQGPRVRVLTDGIGSLDAAASSVDHATPIDPLTAQRIEVLRGPAVLLFGGDAIGGAVNVIDKRIPRDVPEEAIHIDALAGYGSAANDWSAAGSVDVPLTNKLVFPKAHESCHYEAEISFLMEEGKISAVGFGLDLTLREVQSKLKAKGLPWERAKAFDNSAVFSRFVNFDGDVNKLEVELFINGELKQKGDTTLMINKPSEIIKEVNTFLSFDDGDILMTGTPKGVGKFVIGDEFLGRILYDGEVLIEEKFKAI